MKLTEQIYYRHMYFSMPIKAGPNLREVYNVLLKGEKNVLVDAGVSYNYPDVVQLLAEADLTVKDIDVIIITHCHADHTGGIAKLVKENPDIEIWASPLCGPMIEDIDVQFKARPVPAYYTIMGGPVKVTRQLEDGETIDIGFPIRIIYTPGHSADSISVYLPEKKVLISGDAIPYINDLPIYEDLDAVKSSLEKLRVLPTRYVISAFCGLWDQYRQPEIFALTEGHLNHVQESVDTFLKEHDQYSMEDMGRFVISELGLDALPIPIFITSLKEHIKASANKEQ